MVNSKLLILGDSFGAEISKDSWTSQLPYQITNLSSRGSSEYRIVRKLEKANLDLFDKILIVHTSPNRIYVEQNPIHMHDVNYQECDLIYSDVKDKPHDNFAKMASWWFEQCWNVDCANYIHNLLIKQIICLTKNKGIHVTFFDYQHPMLINLNSYWEKFPGDINHLSIQGNAKVAPYITSLLEQI